MSCLQTKASVNGLVYQMDLERFVSTCEETHIYECSRYMVWVN